MEAPFQRTLDAGRRVQVFLDTQVAAIAGAISASLRAMLDTAVASLVGFQGEQTSAAGLTLGETANQAKLRAELYDRFVVPVLRTAKLMLRTSPDYPNLALPKSIITSTGFASAVKEFAKAAARNQALFVKHGMPTDFVAQLDAAIAEVEASGDTRSRQIARRKAATEGCRTSYLGVRAYLGIIDGILRPVLAGNPALLRDWDASKMVRQPAATPLSNGTLVADTSSADVTPVVVAEPVVQAVTEPVTDKKVA